MSLKRAPCVLVKIEILSLNESPTGNALRRFWQDMWLAWLNVFLSSFSPLLPREKYFNIILKMEEMLKNWFPNVKLQDQVVVTETEDAAPAKKPKVKFEKQLGGVRAPDRQGLVSRTQGVDAVNEGAKHLLLFNHKSGTRKGGLKAIFAAVFPQSLIR